MPDAKTATRFSLKKKLIILIVSIIVAIILLSALFCYKGLSDINRTMYLSRTRELSDMEAALLDPQDVKSVRDRVMEIYRATENKVSTEEWGTPEFEAYLKNYRGIEDSEEFKEIIQKLRIIQDNNHLEAAYLIWFDLDTESTIYLVDASYDDYCAPGCFDPIMYEVDFAAMRDPEHKLEADITNTDEYGWVVAAGSPVYADGELVAFAATELSMNEVMAQRNRFLLIALGAMLGLAVVAITVSILMIERTIIRPINKLSDTSVKYWSSGNSAIHHEFSQLQIHTGDEIETLSNSMKQMEQNINDHITQILETTQALVATREHAEEMDKAANIDALTKVRNKRAYDIELEKVNQEIRDGKTDFGLAMVDLNYLKKTNDTYGHEYGNIMLQKLCRIICSVFQHSSVFRIGGDEFIVIFSNHDYEHLEELKENLNRSMQETEQEEHPWERVSAAVGYALFDPAMDRDMESVFKRADKQMYECKKQMKAERGQ